MAPLKRVAKTPEEAKANGLATIHDFFKAAPKKDRRAASAPKVDKSRRGLESRASKGSGKPNELALVCCKQRNTFNHLL